MIVIRRSLSERQYGVGSDLIHSGIKRTARKYIGRGRVALADRLARSADVDFNKGSVLRDLALRPEAGIQNQLVGSNLKKTGDKLNTGVFDIQGVTPRVYLSPNETIRSRLAVADLLDPRFTELSRSIRRGDYYENYILGRIAEGDKVAHELGHIANSMSRNKTIRTINEKATKKYPTHTDDGPAIFYKGVRPTESRSVLSSFIRGNVINQEERNASNHAMKLLKRAGANKQELSQARTNYKNALGSYQQINSGIVKADLSQLVQIPSRRKYKVDLF